MKTIALPNISTGVYHFPKAPAARIAIDTVMDDPGADAFEKITFVCFDDETGGHRSSPP
jgi:O-acetyl-ADP-ribose deacetylase (regulator of RNase III)